MVKEQQFWFNGWTSRSLLPGPALSVTDYDLSAAPATWKVGQAQTFTVRPDQQRQPGVDGGGAYPVRLSMHFATTSGGWPNQVGSVFAAWLRISDSYYRLMFLGRDGERFGDVTAPPAPSCWRPGGPDPSSVRIGALTAGLQHDGAGGGGHRHRNARRPSRRNISRNTNR